MNSYKNKMKVCFIIAIVCAILNTFVVISDIVDKSGLVSVYIDASCLASTIFSSIVYGIFLSKDIAFAKRYRALLIVTCCFSFIGSILLGIFAVLAINDLNNSKTVELSPVEQNPEMQNGESESSTNETNIESENNTVNELSSNEEKKTRPTAEELIAKITTLDKMKKEGTITSEEYDTLKSKILDEITK